MITLWGQIIIAWQRLAPQFSCFCKGHHDFFAYISDQNIFFEMTIFSNWQQAVWDSLIKFQPSHGAVDFLGNFGAFCWANPNPDSNWSCKESGQPRRPALFFFHLKLLFLTYLQTVFLIARVRVDAWVSLVPSSLNSSLYVFCIIK